MKVLALYKYMKNASPESWKGMNIRLGLNYFWLFEIQNSVESSTTTLVAVKKGRANSQT